MIIYQDFSPKISVLIPTYNRKGILKRAVESVLKQTFKNFELIIIDDGSTDNTSSVIWEYQKQFENIRYLRHSNRKLPLTLNAGIQASVSEYITFLGSDDEYRINHLETRWEIIENNKSIDVLYGGVEIIGNPFVKDKNDLSKEIHLSECIIGGTFFGKRKVFIETNGFNNLDYSEDSEFYERASEKFRFVKTNIPTYVYYRDLPDSICNNI
jgi:glycosyltransferase involved in cell wall biosynthesis